MKEILFHYQLLDKLFALLLLQGEEKIGAGRSAVPDLWGRAPVTSTIKPSLQLEGAGWDGGGE